MAVTGHESNDDLKFQLARRLYTAVVLNSSILKVKDVLKVIEIERIVNILKKRSLWNGIRAFLQNYPCSFLVLEENGCSVIKPIVTIGFCRDFDGKRGCTRGFCPKLHVCRHFVKGKCTFGPRCKKPHHFQNENTREVLRRHFLGDLNDEQTREFLCRNVQHLLDPEIANAELPKCLEICKYYNVATGCTRELCPYIHVCRFFAEEGNCKFGVQCIRKHDINNVHSKILLHRYHMDHLNEQQVLAYLKIKGENRDQQQQQQQQQSKDNNKPASLVSSNNSINITTNGVASQYPSHLSLPNAVFGSLHNLMNERNSRKLSQPTPGINALSIMDPMNQQRKLSLPTPPMPRTAIYRPSSTKGERSSPIHVTANSNRVIMCGSNRSQSACSPILSTRNSSNLKANSWNTTADTTIDNNFSGSNSPIPNGLLTHTFGSSTKTSSSSYLSDENFRNVNCFPSDSKLLNSSVHFTKPSSAATTTTHLSKSFNDTNLTHGSLTRDFSNNFSLHDEHKQQHHQKQRHNSSQYSSTSSLSYDHLGLHNLSLSAASTSGNQANDYHQQNIHTTVVSNNNTISSMTNSGLSKNDLNNQFYRLTDSFDNIASDCDDQMSNTSNSLQFSNSLRSQTNSLFANHNPVLRTSSNEIASPTGSSSSINGITNNNNNNNNNNNGRSPVFDMNDPFSEWHEGGERVFKSFSSKDNTEEEFNMPYYRTRSLPNFRSTSLYKGSLENLKSEKTPSVSSEGNLEPVIIPSECICQNKVCVQYLSKNCKVNNCLKQHSEEPFVWQIAAVPSRKSYNNFKNETFDNNKKMCQQKLTWINIDENENVKLELAYCSVELEQSDVELYGDSITINFEDMTGEGRWDINGSTSHMNSRSCDLSAWLLQATDADVPSRRNSQDAVLYHVRRLSTPSSSICDEFDLKYSTHWCWYWQDSFGMWRSFPRNLNDVIETTSTCISDDIEAIFLKGNEQWYFDVQKLLFDFKSMVQTNRQTGKQKRIRRRPQFISKEQRNQILSPTGSFSDDFIRPWYWTNESTNGGNNSSYNLVDVEDTSEMLSNVRRLFSQSMIGKTFEIMSIKLVQNVQLWTKFTRLRSQLKASDIKITEKFVFKCVKENQLSGICQQGFQICTCKQGLENSTENTFATEAKSFIQENDQEDNDCDIRYMFCVRMAVPLCDIKDKSFGSSILTDKVEEEDEESSSDDDSNWVPSPTLPNKNSNLVCRHSNQVYPEFLIVFRL